MNKKERAFLHALPRADQRYFAELSARLRSPSEFAQRQKGKAFDMEKEQRREKRRRIGKYVFAGVLAAAVLGGGGMAAIVAMRGANGGNNQSDGSSRSAELSGQTERNTLGLHLTDQQWDNSAQRFHSPLENYSFWYTASDTGWYHSIVNTFAYDTIAQLDETEQDELITKFYADHGSGISIIGYSDAESGGEVPLCARPNCLHYGDDFCEASTEKYVQHGLVAYDGVLYAAAGDRDQYNSEYTYLLSYAPDGTGITELARIRAECSVPIGTPVIHSGYVWWMAELHHRLADFNPENPSDENTSNTGYAIFGYEIATGKTLELYRSMPDAESNITYPTPVMLCAGGDRLCYQIGGGDWQAKNSNGIFSIDLKTGAHRQVVSGADIGMTGFTMCGSTLIYQVRTPNVSYTMKMNLDTGESEKLFDAAFEDYTTDGSRFYGLSHVVMKEDGVQKAEYRISVYDLASRELLQTVSYRYRHALRKLSVRDGFLYALDYNAIEKSEEGVVYIGDGDTPGMLCRCSIDSLLSGSPEWEPQCTLIHNYCYNPDDGTFYENGWDHEYGPLE